MENNIIEKYLDKVFLKDIMELLKELPDRSVDMVYGDPDYNVGIKYGDKSYTKNFDEYIEWYIELAKESLRVLKDTGNMFLINYPKQNAHLRVKYLDSVCYEVLDYAWVYNTNVGHSPNRFTTAHRNVLHCRKTKESKFYKDNVAVPYKNPTDKRILQNLSNGSKGRMPYDWLYFDLVKNISKEKTFHACQIPQKLSEMLIKSCTMEGDIILILFGGSGSEIEVCKILKRQYISSEIDEKYYKMILDRLNNGRIDERYKLRLKSYEDKNILAQLTLFEEETHCLGGTSNVRKVATW
ncbi:MAG: site-specific DNA-methyltransferase [bacterium]|nr:site-specific DNA-methyltransferase [bacterium]